MVKKVLDFKLPIIMLAVIKLDGNNISFFGFDKITRASLPNLKYLNLGTLFVIKGLIILAAKDHRCWPNLISQVYKLSSYVPHNLSRQF